MYWDNIGIYWDTAKKLALNSPDPHAARCGLSTLDYNLLRPQCVLAVHGLACHEGNMAMAQEPGIQGPTRFIMVCHCNV